MEDIPFIDTVTFNVIIVNDEERCYYGFDYNSSTINKENGKVNVHINISVMKLLVPRYNYIMIFNGIYHELTHAYEFWAEYKNNYKPNNLYSYINALKTITSENAKDICMPEEYVKDINKLCFIIYFLSQTEQNAYTSQEIGHKREFYIYKSDDIEKSFVELNFDLCEKYINELKVIDETEKEYILGVIKQINGYNDKDKNRTIKRYKSFDNFIDFLEWEYNKKHNRFFKRVSNYMVNKSLDYFGWID